MFSLEDKINLVKNFKIVKTNYLQGIKAGILYLGDQNLWIDKYFVLRNSIY